MKSVSCVKIILLLLQLSVSFPCFSQSLDLRFEHLTIEDGLSNNTVKCILQDNYGFMWFGTQDGLNRYDGHTFRILTNLPSDSNSLSGNSITYLLEDSLGFLWIGTTEGLNKYDPVSEKFSRYTAGKNVPGKISNNMIYTIFQDSRGILWIGTEFGLNRYNRETDDFQQIFFQGQVDSAQFYWNNYGITIISEDHNNNLMVGTIHDFLRYHPETGKTEIIPDYYPDPPREDYWPVLSAIIKDKSGKYWITMLLDGIASLNSENGEVRLFTHNPEDPNSFSADFANSLYEDQNGRIWIGSDDGLNIFDKRSEKFMVYKHDSRDESSICGNTILAVYGDRQGNTWIGTRNNGISKVSRWKKPFRHYTLESEGAGNPASGEVLDICEDHYGNIWTGSYGGGIAKMNPAVSQIEYFRHRPRHLHRSEFNMVYDIHEDVFGDIWSSYIAINYWNLKTREKKHYIYRPQEPKDSHSDTFTYLIYEDRDNTLWFAMLGAGLERFNRENEAFTHYVHDAENDSTISSNYVYSVFQDRSGRFWTGTSAGLCEAIQDGRGNIKFIRYQNEVDNPNSLSGSIVYSIFEDSRDRFWIGTNNGLNLFDRLKMNFQVWTENNGLPCNDIYAILEDDHSNLWLRTKRGLVKFNPETQSVRTYDERDGLKYCKSIDIGFKAFIKSRTGEMYYGGANGFTVFHPDSIRDNPDTPAIALTDFNLFNHPVRIGPHSLLTGSINTIDEIRLRYDQNNISFDFAALDYTAPDKNQYAYKLEGLNQHWIYCGNLHSASYTNLDPGEYIFHVKGSNNDLVWNEKGRSLKVIITPPWWQTMWAYAGYLIIICSGLIITWRLQLRRIRIRNDLKMKSFETRKLQEIDHLKSRFFANISHEFRTPLTLILGPVSRILTKTRNKADKYDLQLVVRNARRLQRLINQLLDLSRLEMGKMSLQLRETDLIPFLNRIVQSFESHAKLKNVTLSFTSNIKLLTAFTDREKIENIIYNLLSNAFKFTPEQGKIYIKIEPPDTPVDHFIRIIVADTGKGIPADKLEHIFDRFYQVDDSYTKEQEGSGIGLALTKELVERHHGKINVESEAGKGSTFTIYLPADKKQYSSDEFEHAPEEISIGSGDETDEPAPVKLPAAPKSVPIILVVEDNIDMRIYLSECLCENYRIIEAADGKSGLKQARRFMPDLIISDVMMPQMDGFTFCNRIKTDERTSHIPVILLTARADIDSRILGLETGADNYLNKPFDARELKVRINNLIVQRQKLQRRFRSEVNLKPLEMAFNTSDANFLQKLVELIENDITNPGFRVETFVQATGLSRAQLYRKLQSLCGQSVKEFVRTVRLKQAAQILQKHNCTIAEAAYRVGFNNPAYFSECFCKQFGILPSKFIVGARH